VGAGWGGGAGRGDVGGRVSKGGCAGARMLAAQAIEEGIILAVWARSAGVLTMLVTGMVMVAAVV
jgi:hypothetical protein